MKRTRSFCLLLILASLLILLPQSAAGRPVSIAASASVGFYDKLAQGGIVVAVEIALSMVGLAVVIERLINLRRGRIVPTRLADELSSHLPGGNRAAIDALCRQYPSTLSRIVQNHLDHPSRPPAEAMTLAADQASRELKLHLQRAYPIAVVATLEPLLGLFGTVWGMILAFDKVADIGKTGNPAALSGEIAVALITTAVGLAIAIPMLAMHHYFKNRVGLLAIDLEQTLTDLLIQVRPANPAPASPNRV